MDLHWLNIIKPENMKSIKQMISKNLLSTTKNIYPQRKS